tara:strand:- start:3420 stop:3749 length:330 start_codon:yes stop_codon:yes gene_type:complete
MQKINEEEVHNAVDWLKNSAGVCAETKATRFYLEAFSKSLKAILMSKYLELPISAQEREAYSSKEYQDHLKAVKIAIERDEKNKYLRESALVKIETWRTQEANLRAIKL